MTRRVASDRESGREQVRELIEAFQVITPKRLMIDGAWAYRRNRALRELLTAETITHIVTPPYTPRWNGKVERFHQTMEREWAKGIRYKNSTARNRALPHWLDYYNTRRPHDPFAETDL